jgi:hypothetical protein
MLSIRFHTVLINWRRWPVIAGIIVGSVILLAVLACVVNCLCCGYQCCKCCCSCCCPSGRRRNKQPKQPKHFDEPFHQPPPPEANPVYKAPPAPPSYRGAQQTARFDAPKSPSATVATTNDDALPEMPTWAGAVNKHVEDPNHHDDVEMEPLNPPDRKGAGTPGVAYSDYSTGALALPIPMRDGHPLPRLRWLLPRIHTDVVPLAWHHPGDHWTLTLEDPPVRQQHSPQPKIHMAAAHQALQQRWPLRKTLTDDVPQAQPQHSQPPKTPTIAAPQAWPPP